MTGVDLRAIRELGGWKSLVTVMRHAHLSPSHKRNAVEVLAGNSPTLFTAVAPETPFSDASNLGLVNKMGR